MLNRMTLHGRLTAEPELRRTNSGHPVCNFVIANSMTIRSSGTERTLFMHCVAWDGLAEWLCGFFRKGNEILVEGSVWTEKWHDEIGRSYERQTMTVTSADFCGPAPRDRVRTPDDDSDLPWEGKP